MAAHVISYDVLSPLAAAARFVRGGLRFGSINEIGVEQAKTLTTNEIVQQFRQHPRPTGLTARLKGGIALTDGLIHQQDIRWVLNRPRVIPADRLLAALPFVIKAPTLNGKNLIRGLSLRANDLDWQHGEGPELVGPAEALLMAVAGRPAALTNLSGEGLSTLKQRLQP